MTSRMLKNTARAAGQRCMPAAARSGRAALTAAVCVLAASLGMGPLAGCGPKATREHVILITMDTTRADRLGCYGYPLASTPALDSLSSTSTLFAKALVSDPNTLPSHLTMLTGLSPLGHGVRYNGWEWKVPNVPTLAEVLAGTGYTTAGFISAAPLKREFGTASGFQHFDDDWGPRAERPDSETADRVIEYLESGPEGPLFLWVHFFDPHDLYEPPEPFASETKGTPYDAEVSAMDHAIGRVLEALERGGYAETAHVIAVADHGEGLDDREGYTCHGLLLYEEAVRAPMLWHTPGQSASRVDSSLVGCVDIFPTVLDVLGVEAPENADVEGVSLRPVLRDGSAIERDGVYTETIATYLLHQWSPLYGWRTADHKYIAASVPELYDLRNDPRELHNIADENPELVARLHEQLSAYMSAWTREASVKNEAIDAQERELLESLGYIQPSTGNGHAPAPRSFPSIDDLDGLASPRTHVVMESVFVNVYHYQHRDHWPAIVDEYQVILNAIPDSPAVPFGLAKAYGALGDAEESLRWIDRHLELRSTDSPAHLIRGNALLALGRYAEASADFEKVEPADVDAAFHQSRLKVAVMTGDRQGVGQALRACKRQVFPKILRAWETAADVLDSLGTDQPASGARDLSRQVDALLTLGIVRTAAALTEASADQSPDSLMARLRGNVSYVEADLEAARAHYLQAQALGVAGLESRIAEIEKRLSRQRTRALPKKARS